MTMTKAEWNIRCNFCGFEWHSRGRFVEDFLCFKCQGWIPDKGGKVLNPEGLADLKRTIAAKVREAM